VLIHEYVTQMKYLLFANNLEITDDALNNITLNDNDILVTFNHAYSIEKLNIFKSNKNKIYHFSRRSFNRKILYSGILTIDLIKNRFNKIFLYPHPESIGSKQQKEKVLAFIKNNTTFNVGNFSHMRNFSSSHNVRETKKFLSQRYNKVSNLSMGLIGYLYLQQIKNKDDEIILVGFTHKMNKNKHNPQGEEEFFKEQKRKNLCQIIELK
jgi:hypothetical protein